MRFFSMIIGSFHSAELYRRVRREQNFNLLYTLGLVLLCSFVTAVYYGNIVHRELFIAKAGQPPVFDSIVTQIAEQTPIMTYKDGRLMTKEPQATVITISGALFGESFDKVALITVDTTGQSTHQNMKTPVLITQTEMIVKDSKETKIQPLDKFADGRPTTLVINRAVAMDAASTFITVVHENLTKFYIFFGGFMWLIFALFSYVLRIFMVLILGLAGLVIAALVRTKLDYSAAVSLAAVSFTPVALLETAILIGAGYPVHTSTLFIAGVVTLSAAIIFSKPLPEAPAAA